MHKISIPKGARAVLLNLRYENHEAYVVGGCVRDSLLGKEPKDWDICTSATPDEVKELMHRRGIKTIDTGLQHGTVTVDMGTVGKYEVTTFRIDGNYTDGRHPDYVEFTESIYKDLSRRDFTINAMAYNSAGLIDPFHGRDDLQAGIIRCVGNPDERFEEDALRILRALRFAATYGFSIEEQTAAAIHKDAWMLKRIAAERINGELCKMLLGDGILNVLLNFSDVIATIIPEMEPCIGFEQNNKYHQYTVYEHIAHAVANYKGTDVSVKVALLLHDIGKPQCYTEDENGGHFHGHGVPSRDIAEQELGERRFSQFLDVRMADILAHAEGTQESRIERCIALGSIMSEVLEAEQCFALKDLQINGRDIMNLGIEQGKRVGEILNSLLDEVISGALENEHNALMQRAVELLG